MQNKRVVPKGKLVHHITGHINSVPVPTCGTVMNGITYTRNRLDLVTCSACVKVLKHCGVEIQKKPKDQRSEEAGDVVTYSLPSFAWQTVD